MKSADIREAFLHYFEQQNHQRVDSSSLVPGNDPTLLFTNAGMVQFKDVFLGSDKRPYSRAASSQRCVRAGGKHNDLENVGYTARHHTFFEMLGNFSFGDYFKREAIEFAWQFLTEVLQLPPEKLWVTVHISDDEAEKIWKEEIGIDPERFSKLDEDNFWQMGDTGPCGPSSEIFYDHGEDVPGGPPGSDNDDLDRYIEIWNLVFMQYERGSDGSLTPLPKPSVDTGMGLERIAAVMQGVHSNYDIDLFQALIKAAAQVTGTKDLQAKSLRVIADHIRSSAFLILDGVQPGNEGRAYVLRRIMRRAIRHGHQLGAQGNFFHQLVGPLATEMGAAYPALKEQADTIAQVVLREEEQFAKTLEHGMAILEDAIATISDAIIPGDLVFKLYDTYGFPVDLTADIAREKNLNLDMRGYEQAMQQQRQRSQEAGKFSIDYTQQLELDGETLFSGYDTTTDSGTVLAILNSEGEKITHANAESEATLILDSTPFYAESGGQVGDTGFLHNANSRFEVRDTQKAANHHLHLGKLLSGSVQVGDKLEADVDNSLRQSIRQNHSATHLLHAALRTTLGEHVQQKGSLVDSDKLRFDFSHPSAVSQNELEKIEHLVNTQIQANTSVSTTVTSMEQAQALGAMALFGEKYGDEVRVLAMGQDNFSVELCGGTHVDQTGEIAVFRINAETGIASGVRRIEATTGSVAISRFKQQCAELISTNEKLDQDNIKIAEQLQTDYDCALKNSSPSIQADAQGSKALQINALMHQELDKLHAQKQALQAQKKSLEKALQKSLADKASSSSQALAEQAQQINGIHCLAARFDEAAGSDLRNIVDKLRNQLGTSVVLLAVVDGQKISLVAGVSQDATDRIKAGDLMKEVAPLVGGKGGGRPDMAQGGGSDISALDGALEHARQWLSQKLA